MKPLERRHEAREGFVGKRRSGSLEGKPLRDHPVEKKLWRGKAQECGELEEASEGQRSQVRREGSQTLRVRRAVMAPPSSYLDSEGFKGNRARRLGYAEGHASRERSLTGLTASAGGTEVEASFWKGKGSRWRERTREAN